MSLPDSTAGAALASSSFQVAWLAWLDFSGDPVRATTAARSLTLAGTGDPDLDGFTFDAVDPTMVAISEVKNKEGGSDTITFTMSGIVGPDTDLLNIIGDKSLWQGRTARLWAIIYDEAGAQQGAIWPVYTGRMSGVQIAGEPSGQTISLDVESYLAYMKQASGRTYLDQSQFDPNDNTASLKLAAANGSKDGAARSYAPVFGGAVPNSLWEYAR
ncbi:MAG: hypothetical protein ACK40C_09360 [Novosphingobium meiothermophilum]